MGRPGDLPGLERFRFSEGVTGTLTICRRGVHNVLAHLGVLPDETPTTSDTPLFELAGSSAFVYASMDGVFEPFHEHGREVHAGEAAGRIHCTWMPTLEPETVHYHADGILYGRRQPGRVKPGNCCLVVASPYEGDLS